MKWNELSEIWIRDKDECTESNEEMLSLEYNWILILYCIKTSNCHLNYQLVYWYLRYNNQF